MIYKLTMKCPDAVDRMMDEADSEDETDQLFDLVTKFVKYREYATLEFDTETGTVKVLEV